MSTGSETGALWLGAKEALYNFDLACAFGAVAALVATIAPRRTVASAP